MSSPTLKKEKENVKGKKRDVVTMDFWFLERVSNFSLGLRTIRPSEFFGARRKTVLRGEGNAWTPVLRTFNKLHEVVVSSYVSFTLCLSTLLMLELNEAVRGRLIGSKSWNRGVGFLGTHVDSP